MLLQLPLGVVTPTVPLKALPTLPDLPMQPRAMDSTRIFAGAAQTLPPASRTRKKPKDQRDVIGRDHHWPIPGNLNAAVCADGAGVVGTAANPARSARPIGDLGPGVFEWDLLGAPGSVGWLRTRILLPRTWRDWDNTKFRAVLAHERAHLRRRDWLIRVASHVNVCIFWFHPMAWWLERELARLAEEACDDAALSEMDDREEYAATLMDIARAACAGPTRSELESYFDGEVIRMSIRRVNRILNGRTPVPKSLGRLAWGTFLYASCR